MRRKLPCVLPDQVHSKERRSPKMKSVRGVLINKDKDKDKARAMMRTMMRARARTRTMACRNLVAPFSYHVRGCKERRSHSGGEEQQVELARRPSI